MQQSNKATFFFSIFLLVFGGILFYSQIFKLPHGIHEWAQADRLALAYGFIDNNLNFLKPATLSQYSKDGIVGVEFPIQAYITAVIATLFKIENISLVFRLVNIILAGIFISWIYKIAYKLSNNSILSLVIPLLFIISPAFLDYASNYIPDTLSAMICIAGIGLFFETWILKSNNRNKGLILLSIATLIKSSAGIYLFSVLIYDWYLILIRKNQSTNTSTLIKYFAFQILSAISIIGYFFYNKYLNSTFNSQLFLMTIRPIESFYQMGIIIKNMFKVWAKEYFILPAYIFIIGGILLFYLGKNPRALMKKLLPLTLISLVGIIAFFFLFGSQFYDHDYYFIVPFFPFIAIQLFGLIASHPLRNINKPTNLKIQKIGWSLVGMLLIYSFVMTKKRMGDEYLPHSLSYRTYWMQGSDQVLDSLHLNDIIVVLGENAPNLSLIYMNRKGYVLNYAWWEEHFESANHFFNTRNLKYGICELEEFQRLSEKDADAQKYFEIFAQNEHFVVIKIKDEIKN